MIHSKGERLIRSEREPEFDGPFGRYAHLIHEMAKEHGWWDIEPGGEQRTFGDVVALIHSEVSEALEDYRNGLDPARIYFSSGGKDLKNHCTGDFTKPVGVPIELADVQIRILDATGFWHIDPDRVASEVRGAQLSLADAAFLRQMTFAEKMTELHCLLSRAWQSSGLMAPLSHQRGLTSNSWTHLMRAFLFVDRICSNSKIDIQTARDIKIAYNSTRSHRHGGKKL